MSTTYRPSSRAKVKRAHQRAAYDQDSVFKILDAAQMINVGYVIEGQPYVTPTFHWRQGDTIFWHGSSASKMLRQVRTGVPVCVTAAIFDGYVLARSPLHHSANYRTVMAFGNAMMIEGRTAKEAALKHMMEVLFPGRWAECRANYSQEIKATTVVAMKIEEAAAKTRCGPPIDDEEDYDTVKVWSGEIPALHPYGPAIADPRLDPACPLPDYLDPYQGR
jgi:nitroimidazol reductase NimA-like FMN-containing flavoprotein (pyridoxamine 5'-phosphate oxidase superfamily)